MAAERAGAARSLYGSYSKGGIMQTISFKDAMFRASFTEHGLALLDVVARQPGIALETLIRDHDPAPAKLIGSLHAHFAELVKENLASSVAAFEPKDAIRRFFPAGGHAVKQLCEAGALVITKRLRVYRPQDLPPKDLSERSEGGSSDESQESEGALPGSTERHRASA